eukprot:g60283.t1
MPFLSSSTRNKSWFLGTRRSSELIFAGVFRTRASTVVNRLLMVSDIGSIIGFLSLPFAGCITLAVERSLSKSKTDQLSNQPSNQASN